jgi:hypothetical protein
MTNRISGSYCYCLDYGRRVGLCAELMDQLRDARAEHAAAVAEVMTGELSFSRKTKCAQSGNPAERSASMRGAASDRPPSIVLRC